MSVVLFMSISDFHHYRSLASLWQLMFTTASACVPKIRFWTESTKLQVATGTTTTYTTSDMCGAPANVSIAPNGQIASVSLLVLLLLVCFPAD